MYRKGRKGAEHLNSFFLSLALIVDQCKKYCIFPTHIDTDHFFLKLNAFKKDKISRGALFFPQRPNYPTGMSGKFCQELATLGGRYHRYRASASIIRIRTVWLLQRMRRGKRHNLQLLITSLCPLDRRLLLSCRSLFCRIAKPLGNPLIFLCNRSSLRQRQLADKD